ncbi:MAG: hypothetical protein KBT09_10355 [Bacteroidales bacterium]|nr:hypothetical protein [Candidatus Sodaliphilus fimicaballi]
MLNTIPEIKKEFFAYRNGIVADMLRKNGDPHQFIMGCQLVDVVNISNRVEHTVENATRLWSDRNHRECRMIAPMLYPIDEMQYDVALDWAESVECNEIADVLCHRLLRRLPFAWVLSKELVNNDSDLVKYTGYRLVLNLLLINAVIDKTELKNIVEKEKVAQPQRDIVQLLDSIEEEL